MQKLLNRQVILSGIVGLMALYGVYNFMFATKPTMRDSTKSNASLSAFLSDVNTHISDSSFTAVDLYLIKRAETEWLHNPFLGKNTYREWLTAQNPAKSGELKSAVKTVFYYTGYLELGKKKMAIVNGMEYGVGDALEIEGYILKMITPSQVIIESKTDRIKFTVPLQD